MRHKCTSTNCFLDRHVLKFEVFADLFPGGMNFSDIDGCFERKGQMLFMEWKEDSSLFNVGQGRMFAALSEKPGIICIDVVGSPRTMECSYHRTWTNGSVSDWEPCHIMFLRERIRQWFERVERMAA